MSPKEYMIMATTLVDLHNRKDGNGVDWLHPYLGIASETGELLDLVKKAHLGDARPERNSIIDECGDILCYIANILKWNNSTFEEAMLYNAIKLEYRGKHGKNKEAERKLQLAASA